MSASNQGGLVHQPNRDLVLREHRKRIRDLEAGLAAVGADTDAIRYNIVNGPSGNQYLIVETHGAVGFESGQQYLAFDGGGINIDADADLAGSGRLEMFGADADLEITYDIDIAAGNSGTGGNLIMGSISGGTYIYALGTGIYQLYLDYAVPRTPTAGLDGMVWMDQTGVLHCGGALPGGGLQLGARSCHIQAAGSGDYAVGAGTTVRPTMGFPVSNPGDTDFITFSSGADEGIFIYPGVYTITVFLITNTYSPGTWVPGDILLLDLVTTGTARNGQVQAFSSFVTCPPTGDGENFAGTVSLTMRAEAGDSFYITVTNQASGTVTCANLMQVVWTIGAAA